MQRLKMSNTEKQDKLEALAASLSAMEAQKKTLTEQMQTEMTHNTLLQCEVHELKSRLANAEQELEGQRRCVVLKEGRIGGRADYD